MIVQTLIVQYFTFGTIKYFTQKYDYYTSNYGKDDDNKKFEWLLYKIKLKTSLLLLACILIMRNKQRNLKNRNF